MLIAIGCSYNHDNHGFTQGYKARELYYGSAGTRASNIWWWQPSDVNLTNWSATSVKQVIRLNTAC